MSYEQFRHAIVSRLTESDIPPAVLNRIMTEIDVAAQDYKIERQCTTLTVYNEGVQPMVKLYIASLSIRNCARTTLSDYTRILSNMFDTIRKPYNQITTNDIRLYLSGIGRQVSWSPETREHNRSVIVTFFSWLVDNEYLSRNPAKNIPITRLPKKKLKPLRQIELEKIRSVCRTPRERALVDLLFASGVRVSEAAALTLDCIDWNNHTVHILHGKGDKERFSYFNPESEISLRAYLDSRKGNDPHVFCKTRAPYTGVSLGSLEKEIRRIRARVPDLSVRTTPHTFRRTAATVATDRGMPVQEVQIMLGHESIETTMRYVTVDDSRVAMDYSRFMAG